MDLATANPEILANLVRNNKLQIDEIPIKRRPLVQGILDAPSSKAPTKIKKTAVKKK